MESRVKYDSVFCLSWGDVAVDSRSSPTMVKVHLKRSKCDQFGKGVDVIVGRTDSPVCPVAAVVAFIASREDRPGPFFLDGKHAPVTKVWFVKQVRDVLSSLGLPQSDYAGHSFRIGAATSAALAIPPSKLWVGGRAPPSFNTSGCLASSWLPFLAALCLPSPTLRLPVRLRLQLSRPDG